MTTKAEKKVNSEKAMLAFKRRYIREHRGSNDPSVLLRVVRFILRTPEGADVVAQAEKIMKRVIKSKL